mmetsp:Transcript_33903/g.97566  ORF Transcript_33903/g.97566 Transcript_33903/m.97566 type:complete len:200 (-) Transcript_33903:7-606(-)
MKRSPSGKIFAHFIGLLCENLCSSLPEAASHILAEASRLQVSAHSPEETNCTPATSAVWPRSSQRRPLAPQMVTSVSRMPDEAIWNLKATNSSTCRNTSCGKEACIMCSAASAPTPAASSSTFRATKAPWGQRKWGAIWSTMGHTTCCSCLSARCRTPCPACSWSAATVQRELNRRRAVGRRPPTRTMAARPSASQTCL